MLQALLRSISLFRCPAARILPRFEGCSKVNFTNGLSQKRACRPPPAMQIMLRRSKYRAGERLWRAARL
jgi:hypothetical protein